MSGKNYIKSISKNIKNNYIRMVIGAVLSFVASIVFARGLGPDKYGIYTYITWFTSTVACLLGFGLEGTITKFLPEYFFNENIEDSRLLIKGIVKLQLILITIISLILLITMPFWKGMLKISTSNIYILLILAIINILPTILSSILTSSVQALQRFDIYAKVTIKTQIITFILNLIVIIVLKKVEYLIVILILSMIYQVTIYYKNIKKIINFRIRDLFENEKIKNIRRIKKYAAYMYINIVWQQVVWTKSEYFFLGIYCGAKEIAMYGLAYSLVNMGNMIFSPVMTVLNNYFSELVAKKEEELLKNIIIKVTKYFTIVLLLILTYAYAFSGYIIKFIYSSKYDEVVVLFLIMFTGFVISQIVNVSASIPFLYEKQKWIIYLGIVSGVINVVLDIVLIPKIGAKGAAIANVLSQLFCTIIGYIYILKILKIKIKINKILLVLLISLTAIVSISLFNYMLIKLTIVTIYTIVYIYLLFITKIIDVNDVNIIRS